MRKNKRIGKLNLVLLLLFVALESNAQNNNEFPDTAKAQLGELKYPDTAQALNTISGELTPGRGFNLVKTKFGTLNLSIYALVRYLDQTPGTQIWYDHLGNPQTFVGRNDIYWHRTMLWFTGWLLFTPQLTYTATVWTVMTTQQTLVYGNLQYTFNEHFRFEHAAWLPTYVSGPCRDPFLFICPLTVPWEKKPFARDSPTVHF